MIGIEFDVENQYNNFLNDLFENINLNDFEINITEDEIYYNNQNLDFDKLYTKALLKKIFILFLLT